MPIPEISFYLDEHIDPAIAHGLRLRGIRVVTTAEAELLHAPDQDQLAYAHENSLIVVTRDEDFLTLNAQGLPHSGIVFWHSKRSSIGRLINDLTTMWRTLNVSQMVGRVQFV